MSRLTLIVAATKNNGIGQNGILPWRLPKELKYFSDVTSTAPEGKQNVVIMGRKCWESIPKKRRPLPRRMNVVVSRNKEYDLGVAADEKNAVLKDNLKAAFSILDPSSNPHPLSASSNLHRAFIIGGSAIYSESLSLPLPPHSSNPTEPYVDRVLLTRINDPAFDDCDVFMPDFTRLKDDDDGESARWRRASHATLKEWVGFDVPEGELEENGVKYEFQMWVREA